MKNVNNFTKEEMNLAGDLRTKSVMNFVDDLAKSNDILEILISRSIPGGVRCFMNMETAFSILFIMYIEMLKNGVPNDVLEEVFLNLSVNIVKKAGIAMEELKGETDDT